MADDSETSCGLNKDEALEGSSTEEDNADVNNAENSTEVKTFKDLVGWAHRVQEMQY